MARATFQSPAPPRKTTRSLGSSRWPSKDGNYPMARLLRQLRSDSLFSRAQRQHFSHHEQLCCAMFAQTCGSGSAARKKLRNHGGQARDINRGKAHILSTIAQLSVVVEPPALDASARKQCAGMVASRRNRRNPRPPSAHRPHPGRLPRIRMSDKQHQRTTGRWTQRKGCRQGRPRSMQPNTNNVIHAP